MGGDMGASQFDVGSTSIRPVRARNVIQILSCSSVKAPYLYREVVRAQTSRTKIEGRIEMKAPAGRMMDELDLIAAMTEEATMAAAAKVSRLGKAKAK